MALEYIQAQIGYQFFYPERLGLALRAAHRSDEDGSSDDGNRRLAKLGMRAVEMTETYHSLIVENRTSKEFNIQEKWFHNRKKRADVCKKLGVGQFVTLSVRQQGGAPSPEVLATALSAIIGAIWLDLQTQNANLSTMVEQTFVILRKMETAVANAQSTGTPPTPLSTADEIDSPRLVNSQGTQEGTPFEEYLIDMSGGMLGHNSDHLAYDQLQLYDTTQFREAQDFFDDFQVIDFGPDCSGSLWSCAGLPDLYEIDVTPETRLPPENEEAVVVKNGSVDRTDDTKADSKGRKRKARGEQDSRVDEIALHQRLLQEELKKTQHLSPQDRSNLEVLMDHIEIGKLDSDAAQIMRLRLLYFTIGSHQSLLGFKDMLSAARSSPKDYSRTTQSELCPSERYAKICDLGNQQALCTLLRRYHIVELFKTTQAEIQHEGGMIVETPSTHMAGVRGMPGNPANRAQADLTDVVLAKILPGPANGSPRYQKIRKHIGQLRRLANLLTIWTDVYGFGILALLPLSPDQSEFILTDYMLQNLAEKRIKPLSDLVYQYQGPFLMRLSKAVEPALMALVEGNLAYHPQFPIETVGVDVLEESPKGRSLEYLV